MIAESYERIHRSNLVGMGILPLQFLPGENAESLKLTGEEVFEITGIRDVVEHFAAGRQVKVRARQRKSGGGGKDQPSSSTLWSASTLRRKRSTTPTAGFCSTCCGSCWRRNPARRPWEHKESPHQETLT